MPDFPGTLKPPRLASAPSSPVVGQVYYDTVTNQLKVWNGTSWSVSAPNVAYRGDYAAGTTYNDGDIVVAADGFSYVCVKDGVVGSAPVTFPGANGGIPLPAVNGQWIKGSGGVAIWSAITPTDVGLVCARVEQSVDISAASGAYTLVTFNTVNFDTGGFRNGTFPGRLYAVNAGYYIIMGGVRWAGGVTTAFDRIVALFRNGTTGTLMARVDAPQASTAGNVEQQVSTIFYMNAGDYAEMDVYQSSGATGTLQAVPPWDPWLAMARIA